MYADDIVFLSISVCDLQALVNICVNELALIDMNINCYKSGWLRIGNIHSLNVSSISVINKVVQWLNEIRYLGITILYGEKFSVNLKRTKQRYICALNNAIFGKIGLHSSPVVLCSLVTKFCVLILLYAAESLSWNQKMLKSIENAYSQAFMKFDVHTFDNKVGGYCQYTMRYLPIKLSIYVRNLFYFSKLESLHLEPIMYYINFSKNCICK